ncbi:MAG: hypothetical protein IPP29_05800 [Bacteroidetes bacterium]|nr:hypothetical protein [Bacteroidota bacterium]
MKIEKVKSAMVAYSDSIKSNLSTIRDPFFYFPDIFNTIDSAIHKKVKFTACTNKDNYQIVFAAKQIEEGIDSISITFTDEELKQIDLIHYISLESEWYIKDKISLNSLLSDSTYDYSQINAKIVQNLDQDSILTGIKLFSIWDKLQSLRFNQK